MGDIRNFKNTSEASCVCVKRSIRSSTLMTLAFFSTIKALKTCGISSLAANDNTDPLPSQQVYSTEHCVAQGLM